MTMLSLHREALESGSAGYHQFLTRYSTTAKVVYGFVEGKDDPCYYRGFIEQLIPDDWEVELWPAGSKRKVYGIYSMISWVRFPKQRICFFVDRDFVGLISENAVADCNIYVTDDYSIENSLVKRSTCVRILTEVLGLGMVDHGELESVCDLFEAELERFMMEVIPITAWMLLWKRRGQTAYISNIKMNDLFSVRGGQLRRKVLDRGATVTEYLHSRCRVPYGNDVSARQVEVELREGAAYRRFTRGKFVLWFLVEFCCSVRREATTLFISCARSPRVNVTVAMSNAMVIIGNRGRLPESLRCFLRETYCTYVAEVENAGTLDVQR